MRIRLPWERIAVAVAAGAFLAFSVPAGAQDAGPIRNVTPPGILPGPEVTGEPQRLDDDIARYPVARVEGEVFYNVIVYDATQIRVGRTRMRISGISGPRFQDKCVDGTGATFPCGRVARAALKAWIGDWGLACKFKPLGRRYTAYGDCTRNGERLSEWLLSSGFGIADPPP
ncbi:MAG: hypothetical protein KDJ77_09865 [Rhodobiaceae bacterium]|nr:hypothetical protein [Rhodobiaceae bacterium]